MTPDAPPAAFWRAALAEGRILLQRPKGGGRCFFPPRIAAPGSGETDLEWIESAGRGTVYSVTWISRKPPAEAYNVAIVELDEGPRLMSRIEDALPEALVIGQRVIADIVTEDGAPLIVFRTVAA